MPSRPNVLLVMADQHRGDAIGADPHCPTDSAGYPFVHTPELNSLVDRGALFSRAYVPAPICVPARQSLWSGQTPASTGATNWYGHPWEFEHTLAGELTDAGYQTQLIGKTHSHPRGNHVGFERMGPTHVGASLRDDDYAEWLRDRSGGRYDKHTGGLESNTWTARPSHVPEHEHATTWTTTKALEFLEERDEDRPFFLTVSYQRPHPPFDPPQAFWDMYIDRDLPAPSVGDWPLETFGDEMSDYPPTDAWIADLSSDEIDRARAAYYGLVTQIDFQLTRLFEAMWREHGVLDDTLIIYTSDHGEMLGDQYLWRKGFPFEGSARVPLVMQFPAGTEYPTAQTIDRPVGLEDLMPTILEFAGVDIPATVDGRSLLSLVEDPDSDWRPFYHGELGPSWSVSDATQYIVDEQYKYAWNPVTDDEFLFDVESDRRELQNLATDPSEETLRQEYRSTLADHLAQRDEGFSDGDALTTVGLDAWEGMETP
ncbi:sulfatase-like hydrolase/transferase [Haloarcula laminariae]|uniref:sulfatase-like hydrolase/transferase n=1 Tax=Haloarcula laminariae TaxID=2961577 RepID=UPI0021C5ED5D|nr:sulfatase-like hydrolase/transferase [Halomicroarcula laminariae]